MSEAWTNQKSTNDSIFFEYRISIYSKLIFSQTYSLYLLFFWILEKRYSVKYIDRKLIKHKHLSHKGTKLQQLKDFLGTLIQPSQYTLNFLFQQSIPWLRQYKLKLIIQRIIQQIFQLIHFRLIIHQSLSIRLLVESGGN